MVSLETPQANIGAPAADFDLQGTDGKRYKLADVRGKKGLLVMFICNHCPYVQKQLDRLVTLATDLKALGVGVVAISANDASRYPEDSFENMQKLATEKKFPFPYVYDEKQEVARAYGAVCTPDFYGYNEEMKLQYRGRMDSAWSGLIPNPKRELYEAMQEIVADGKTGVLQHASIGCSIKWKSNREKAAS